MLPACSKIVWQDGAGTGEADEQVQMVGSGMACHCVRRVRFARLYAGVLGAYQGSVWLTGMTVVVGAALACCWAAHDKCRAVRMESGGAATAWLRLIDAVGTGTVGTLATARTNSENPLHPGIAWNRQRPGLATLSRTLVAALDEAQAGIKGVEAEIRQVKAQMGELKTLLYARFGSSINLEE